MTGISDCDVRRVLTNARLWKWFQTHDTTDETLIEIRDRLNKGDVLSPAEILLAQMRVFKILNDCWGKGMEFMQYMMCPANAVDEWLESIA